MIWQLVANGCSYMDSYVQGKGHNDLAQRLGIQKSTSLAIGGSANTRIIRTTLKHSYITDQPTFYVLGMTFLSRLEIPILEGMDTFEGRWTNPQNQQFQQYWQYGWHEVDTKQFVELKLKSEVYSILDRIEDLMYKLITMISDLHSRGHRVLVFQQADTLYQQHLSDPRLSLFHSTPVFVHNYEWQAIQWQHEQGVLPTNYPPGNAVPPPGMEHRKIGEHQVLNQFLQDYIVKNKILE